jgi:hypothetical protein
MGCIVAASALAGLALGAFAMVFKGFLAYLGLRYAFNVLELFSRDSRANRQTTPCGAPRSGRQSWRS